MTPLRKFDGNIEFTQDAFIDECKASGTDREAALEEVTNTETWRNDSYIVTLNRDVINSSGTPHKMYCLKISQPILNKEMPWADAVIIAVPLVI